MSERTIAQVCDEAFNPNNLLLRPDAERHSCRSQFKIAGTVPVTFGIQVGFSRACQEVGYGTARCLAARADRPARLGSPRRRS
jgi:hypothetical protein